MFFRFSFKGRFGKLQTFYLNTALCTFREEKASFISISLSVRERKRPPRLVSLVCPSPRRRRRRRRKRDALNDWRKRRRRRRREGDA